ncbi:hypothetical protein L596_024068 [Steinernema carpocapsae]|uniref:Uncharacterized protein n=1 Tax=Steinernema carpocapsae TaxID=34508 RepID=A0A4U5MFL6_STECR|nr:hypothetical protein L596_024068 [Steinernema carpocapsae]
MDHIIEFFDYNFFRQLTAMDENRTVIQTVQLLVPFTLKTLKESVNRFVLESNPLHVEILAQKSNSNQPFLPFSFQSIDVLRPLGFAPASTLTFAASTTFRVWRDVL